MDDRRLSTKDILNDPVIMSKIVRGEKPAVRIPEDRERWDNSEREWVTPALAEVIANLESGKLVTASNYYGIPYAWREVNVFAGVLLQYQNVTENRAFPTAEEAAEWFIEIYHRTDG